MGSPKCHYRDHFVTLITISLFLGSVAFTTQFLLPAPYGCTKPLARLHTLLATSTIILLSDILSVLLLTTLLHPLHEYDLVSGWRKHLLRWGISLIYLYLLVGLVLFALCIRVAYPGDHALGWVGVGLFAVLFIATVILGLTTKGPGTASASHDLFLHTSGSTNPEKSVSDVGTLKITIFVIVFLFEFAALIALLVIGGRYAYEGKVNKDCGLGSFGAGIPWSEGNPLPVGIVAGGVKSVEVILTLTDAVRGTIGTIEATAEKLPDGITSTAVEFVLHSTTIIVTA